MVLSAEKGDHALIALVNRYLKSYVDQVSIFISLMFFHIECQGMFNIKSLLYTLSRASFIFGGILGTSENRPKPKTIPA